MSEHRSEAESAATINNVAKPSDPLGIDVARVTAWLGANVDGFVGPFTFELIAGGHSNLTYKVTDLAGRPVVLRRPPLGHLLASAHDMGREHRIIAALNSTAVPVAPALGFCDDLEVNGAPFYVMGHVDGLVVRTVDDAMTMLTPTSRLRAGESVVDTMAAIHRVDPVEVGLGTLGKHDGYLARQLKRWYSQWEQQKTRELSAVDDTYRILMDNLPEQQGTAIVHGDYRLDNCLVAPSGDVRAVLDWEICTLGDALADVGLLYVYWGMASGGAGAGLPTAPTSAPDFIDRDAAIARYGQVAGRDLSNIDIYIAFGFWKLACIVEGVYARYLHGAMGDKDPESLSGFKQQVDDAAAAAFERASSL
jgi:aminoglycoside phosphotransferase (APT) family kinase protein